MSKNKTAEWVIKILDELNVEDFITQIEGEPAIWNSALPVHSNYVEIEKSWRKVCTQLDPEFDSRPQAEKNQLGKSLHRRWKSLRDCYNRELKKQKTLRSGAAASARKPYIFFEQLRFLEPICCSTESNVEVQEENDLEQHKVHAEDDQDKVINTTETPQYPQPSRSKKKKRDEDLLVDVLTKKISSRSNETATKLSEDPNYMFLMSLMPGIKKIPESLKMFVKTQTMNTILNAQTNSNNSLMPSSSYQPFSNFPVYPPQAQGSFHNQYHPVSFPTQPNIGPLLPNNGNTIQFMPPHQQQPPQCQQPYLPQQQQQHSQRHNLNIEVSRRAQTNSQTNSFSTSPSLLTTDTGDLSAPNSNTLMTTI